ncbi:MAG TPA: hypothetical protein VGK53_05285, partial [Propionicimonas sp.]
RQPALCSRRVKRPGAVRETRIAPHAARTGQLPRREVIAPVLAKLTHLAGSIVDRDNDDGQGLAEYALILALIAIVAIVALLYLGGQISSRLSEVGNAL